jgi:hypothetical protein
MAPFKQREFLQSAYPFRDDSMDELGIEERSEQRGNKDNKHADRDFSGDDSSYFDDYPMAATTSAISPSALAAPTSSIIYGSRTTQPPASSVYLTRIALIQQ